MKSIGKRALVLLGSSLFGATLWLAIFLAIVIGSFHLSKPLRHRPWSIIGGWRRVPLGRNLGHIWCGLCTPSISAKDNFKVAHYH